MIISPATATGIERLCGHPFEDSLTI